MNNGISFYLTSPALAAGAPPLRPADGLSGGAGQDERGLWFVLPCSGAGSEVFGVLLNQLAKNW